MAVSSLAELLRAWRERALLTQEQLAERAGVSVRTIRRLESDDQIRPRGGSLRLLATALDLSGDEQARLNAAARGTNGSDRVPRQLPADVAGFAGRVAHLRELDKLMAAGCPTAVTVTGTAGVGKTTLAVHWAHLVADRFPDGQLYVNLRGFDPDGPPVEPSVAIHQFLEALGVSPHRLPSDPDGRTALYRSTLAGREVLIVLDNARDAAQVRPLLPGTRGCLALVTSRDRLAGLVATEAAKPLAVDLLSTADARDLLTQRLGAERVVAEPAAVDQVITSCAHLPLALAVAAAHATTRPLAAVAEELREDSGRLDALDAGDASADVRQVFDLSYRRLGTAAAEMFRLLGLHPGPDISVPAAASLAGRTIPDARQALAELTRAHLLTEPVPGRFAAHDLLRSYAAELVESTERHAARHRLLDHYLRSAHAAEALLDPTRELGVLDQPRVATAPEHPEGYDEAMAWFDSEHPVLIGSVMLAAEAGFHAYAMHLAWLLPPYLDRRGYWQDWATTQVASLDAAERVDGVLWQARSHRSLGGAYTQLGRWDDAGHQLHRALDLYRALDDRPGQAHTHLDIDWLYDRQTDHGSALRHAEEALGLFQVIDHPSGVARALNNVGWHHIQLGACERGLDFCRRALTIDRELGNIWAQATILDSLGYAHHRLGQYSEAIECYRDAVRLSRESTDRLSEAEALGHLGDAHSAAGDPISAQDAWRAALEILDALDHPGADDLRAKLDCQGTARFEPGRS